MNENKGMENNVAEYTGIEIIEMRGGRPYRVCDPAEFGIAPRPPKPAEEKLSAPERKGEMWSAFLPRQPLVITEESCGKPVRVVDIAEINAIVKKQFNLG